MKIQFLKAVLSLFDGGAAGAGAPGATGAPGAMGAPGVPGIPGAPATPGIDGTFGSGEPQEGHVSSSSAHSVPHFGHLFVIDTAAGLKHMIVSLHKSN